MNRAVIGAWLLIAGSVSAEADRPPVTRVGMAGTIDSVILSGPELEAVPPAEDSPIVLRVVAVYPHGDAFRYDLWYYGLEPGTYDLTDYLRPKAGLEKGELPPLEVTVEGLLPPGQIEPNELTPTESPWLGGYRLLLILGGFVWLIGLLAIIFVGRKRPEEPTAEGVRPKTLAERLWPLVERAMAGELSVTEQAELERILLAFWRKRLGLEDVRPDEVMTRIRAHPEAGALVRQLEAWLHQPGPAKQVDVGELLAPYRDVAAEEAEPVSES